MKRSIFFIIAAAFGVMFGGMMLFAPAMAAENFGLTSTPENAMFFRIVGGLVLSLGVLNFLVRKEPDSGALKSILIVNILSHLIGLAVDLYSVNHEVIEMAKVVPGLVVHVIIGLGSGWYVVKMK